MEALEESIEQKESCKRRIDEIYYERIELEEKVKLLNKRLKKECPHQDLTMEFYWDGHKNYKIYNCKKCKCQLDSWEVGDIKEKSIEYI